MLGLTNLWGKFENVPLDEKKVAVTKRLFLQKLEDPLKKSSPLYLAMNTLSGSIDIFSNEKGEMLESLIHGEEKKASKDFLEQLKRRGYIFPSEEIEDLIYDMIVRHHKNLLALNDKILPFFFKSTFTNSVSSGYNVEVGFPEGMTISIPDYNLVAVKIVVAFTVVPAFSQKASTLYGLSLPPISSNNTVAEYVPDTSTSDVMVF